MRDLNAAGAAWRATDSHGRAAKKWSASAAPGRVPGFQEYSEEVIERVDARERKYYWVGGTHSGHTDIPGSDCNAVANGFISIDLQDLSGRGIITSEDRERFSSAIEKIEWKSNLNSLE